MKIGGTDVNAVADAFASVIESAPYTCYACAIMPDHVHLLIRKHRHSAEEMIVNFQEASRSALPSKGLRPKDHPVWGGSGWKVFLDTPEDIRRTIRYVEENPTKLGMKRQSWSFVKEYDGWPLHSGHNPRSPYAKRLRGE